MTKLFLSAAAISFLLIIMRFCGDVERTIELRRENIRAAMTGRVVNGCRGRLIAAQPDLADRCREHFEAYRGCYLDRAERFGPVAAAMRLSFDVAEGRIGC